MSVAIRAITRIQDADDLNVTLGVGVDEYALVWDNDTARFALRAKAALDANGNLQLAATSYIYQGSLPLLHNYTAPGSTGANIFVGLGVGNFTMSGTGNEASGNTAIGTSAFTANTKGAFNVAVGVHAMEANTIGISNTAVGAGAMYGCISGSTNTAVGDTALGANTTGGQNVAIGDSAIQIGDGGSNNTGVGHAALVYTSASNNVGIGAGALFFNLTGEGNAALGASSGTGITDANRNSLTDKFCTFIGHLASRSGSVLNTTTLENAMALGYDAQVDESNKVVIGNALVTKTVLRGSVGIGTTGPATPLHVVSTTAVTNALRNVITLGANVTDTGVGDVNLGPGILFQAESSTTADQDQARILSYWSTATHATMASKLAFQTRTAGAALATAMTIDGAGQVGIGTTTPGAKIHVVSVETTGTNLLVSQFTKITSDNGGSTISRLLTGWSGNYSDIEQNEANGPYRFSSTYYDTNIVNGYTAAGAAYGNINLVTNNAIAMTIGGGTQSGRVGINDTAPAEALDVTGNINATGVYKVDDVQVLSNRVIDARAAAVANSGDATTDGLIDALRDAMIAHGLIAAA